MDKFCLFKPSRMTGVAIWRQSGGLSTPVVDPGTPYGATLKTWPADLTTAKQTTRLLSTMLGLWSRQLYCFRKKV